MKLDTLVNEEGRLAVETIRRQCQFEWIAQFANHPAFHYTKSPDPPSLPQVETVIGANHLGRGTPSAPVYVYEAVNDEFIAVEDIRELVATYCRKGVDVSSVEDALGEHVTFAAQGAPGALDGLGARFARVRAPSTC